MSCGEKGGNFGPITVWSKRSTTQKLFFPLSSPIPTSGLGSARTSIEMANSTGALKIEPALRTSQDGTGWTTPVTIGTQSRTSDGTTYGDSLVDISATATANQLIQLGVLVSNSSGTELQMGLATLRAELGS